MSIRIPAAEIEANCKQHGLALKLYVVITSPAPGGDLGASRKDHLAHQKALERAGVLFGAGPLLTADGLYGEGEGMIIIRASSVDEALRIAESDPMHKSGARTFTLRPWILNEGALDVRLHLSDQSAAVR